MGKPTLLWRESVCITIDPAQDSKRKISPLTLECMRLYVCMYPCLVCPLSKRVYQPGIGLSIYLYTRLKSLLQMRNQDKASHTTTYIPSHLSLYILRRERVDLRLITLSRDNAQCNLDHSASRPANPSGLPMQHHKRSNSFPTPKKTIVDQTKCMETPIKAFQAAKHLCIHDHSPVIFVT